MIRTVPIAVIIPTYGRGRAIFSVLEKIQRCDPKPADTFVHIDLGDGTLERELKEAFRHITVLTSEKRLGPGGGRHRCLLACTTPYAASFDDDSYPADPDFFLRVQKLFLQHPRAAIFGARIWHRHEREIAATDKVILCPSYVGCGHAVQVAAYRQVRGYLPRPIPYGIEESDLSLQLFAAGWHVYEAGELRVFHDTDLNHHQAPEITSAVISNVVLYAFLNYPLFAWGWGVMQLANKIAYCIRMGRLGGICSGLLRIPGDCYRYRRYRQPVTWRTLRRFLHFRRTGIA